MKRAPYQLVNGKNTMQIHKGKPIKDVWKSFLQIEFTVQELDIYTKT